MKILLRYFVCVLMVGSIYAQSSLPACQGRDVTTWSNCVGTATFTNSSKYFGEFKDGKSNGQGTETFANGSKYVGNFKDDKRNGQGTYTFITGDKYVGEFKDNNYNGQGTITFANGDKYIGEFKNNNYNGQGTYYYFNGQNHTAVWKDGKEKINKINNLFKNLQFQQFIALCFLVLILIFIILEIYFKRSKVQKFESNQKNIGLLVTGNEMFDLKWWDEIVINYKGQKITRIKSSLFYFGGLLSVVIGILMIFSQIPGGAFLFLNCTIFFLYPSIRFLFGGKDSIAGAITTVVFDAYIKSKIEENYKKKRK